MVWYNGQQGRLSESEEGPAYCQHGRFKGVRMVRHRGQHGRLEGSEDEPQ